jgi:hypothetical protein
MDKITLCIRFKWLLNWMTALTSNVVLKLDIFSWLWILPIQLFRSDQFTRVLLPPQELGVKCGTSGGVGGRGFKWSFI